MLAFLRTVPPDPVVPDPVDIADNQRGSFTLSNALGAAVILVVTALLLQGAVLVYGDMVVEEAAWEGARAGAAVGPDECRSRAAEVMNSMMPGLSSDVEVVCGYANGRFVANTSAQVPTMSNVFSGMVTGTASTAREDDL